MKRISDAGQLLSDMRLRTVVKLTLYVLDVLDRNTTK